MKHLGETSSPEDWPRPGDSNGGRLRPSRNDPILEVTGVAATEILDRCAAIRGGRGTAAVANAASRRAVRVWRLIDFADLPEDEFVDAVHEVLLLRRPGPVERGRRKADLHAGSSRIAIIVRLALSPEGRRAQERPVAGVGLPALIAIGRAIERLAHTKGLRSVVGPLEELVRHRRPGADTTATRSD